jgi:hypothetical protein
LSSEQSVIPVCKFFLYIPLKHFFVKETKLTLLSMSSSFDHFEVWGRKDGMTEIGADESFKSEHFAILALNQLDLTCNAKLDLCPITTK